jgi:GNAT superfamily N-acetyltransferase
MIREIAQLHVRALPHTLSSRIGVGFVSFLYAIVSVIGFINTTRKNHKIVGAISGIGPVILTLVIDPQWQRKGMGSALVDGQSGSLWVYTEACSVGFYKKMGFQEIKNIGKFTLLWRK